MRGRGDAVDAGTDASEAVTPAVAEIEATVESVRSDCHVDFEGRQYPVPFQYVGLTVEVRGCAGKVQIVHGAESCASTRGTSRGSKRSRRQASRSTL